MGTNGCTVYLVRLFFLSKNCFNTILHNIFLLHKSDKSNIETRKIGYGSVKLEQFTLYSISYIVVLKDYNPKVTITGDIALIYLEQMFPVEFEDLSVLNYERILDGSNGTIYGFGGHEGWEKWGKWSSYLRYAKIKTRDFNCRPMKPPFINQSSPLSS